MRRHSSIQDAHVARLHMDSEPDGRNLRINVCKPKWTLYGLCYRDNNVLELMFSQNPGKVALAKRICQDCPVKDLCLEYGMDEPYGVFGGYSEEDRRRLRLAESG